MDCRIQELKLYEVTIGKDWYEVQVLFEKDRVAIIHRVYDVVPRVDIKPYSETWMSVFAALSRAEVLCDLEVKPYAESEREYSERQGTTEAHRQNT